MNRERRRPLPILISVPTGLLLVGAMAALLKAIAYLLGDAGHPYGAAYLVPIALATYLGGRLPGAFTLLFSLIATFVFLPSVLSDWNPHTIHDVIGLLFMVVASFVIIATIDRVKYLEESAKRLRSESEDAHRRLRLVLDTAPIGVATCNRDGILDYANAEAERIWGHPLRRVRPEQWSEYGLRTLDGAKMSPEQMCLARSLRGEQDLIEEVVIIERPDGRQRYVHARSRAILSTSDAGSEITGAIVAFVDVTERFAIEAALRESEERYRRLADRLQDAVMPARPPNVPGLDLASHYSAALEEARVGGDFYDMFSLDGPRVALVIGDLSGKGLAAARQVATIRNMLRFALYRGGEITASLRELNAVLNRHHLLTGFASLFLAVYDTTTRSLTYVSCGHEPGLLHRAATGDIEELEATAPVLGAFPEPEFEQRTLMLEPGDVLTLYTDGLTDAGRERREFLGVAGLRRLIAEAPNVETAMQMALWIIAGVNAHALGFKQDDQCLLVALTLPEAAPLPQKF